MLQIKVYKHRTAHGQNFILLRKGQAGRDKFEPSGNDLVIDTAENRSNYCANDSTPEEEARHGAKRAVDKAECPAFGMNISEHLNKESVEFSAEELTGVSNARSFFPGIQEPQ